MIEYKAYHKKSLGKRGRKPHSARKKGKEKKPRESRFNFRQARPVAAALLAVVLVTAAGAAVYSGFFRARADERHRSRHSRVGSSSGSGVSCAGR